MVGANKVCRVCVSFVENFFYKTAKDGKFSSLTWHDLLSSSYDYELPISYGSDCEDAAERLALAAGRRENATLTEPASSHANCLKTQQVPSVGCTLCYTPMNVSQLQSLPEGSAVRV